uniref:hypothetical protein 32 n=1 Tax=Moniliophthora perniciosa TaxID=153609 RepID=UPI0000242379|nr:hypothetical protein 32 [Moniliophthora perniciosa]AAQ74322.1 hypothetical protein 32 [Moniliophthora perniciosa]
MKLNLNLEKKRKVKMLRAAYASSSFFLKKCFFPSPPSVACSYPYAGASERKLLLLPSFLMFPFLFFLLAEQAAKRSREAASSSFFSLLLSAPSLWVLACSASMQGRRSRLRSKRKKQEVLALILLPSPATKGKREGKEWKEAITLFNNSKGS